MSKVAFDIKELSDQACVRLFDDAISAAVRRQHMDAEAALRDICERIWFPAGYRIEELTLIQFQSQPWFTPGGVTVRVTASRKVPALMLRLRRIWRRFFPYKIKAFMGKAVR